MESSADKLTISLSRQTLFAMMKCMSDIIAAGQAGQSLKGAARLMTEVLGRSGDVLTVSLHRAEWKFLLDFARGNCPQAVDPIAAGIGGGA